MEIKTGVEQLLLKPERLTVNLSSQQTIEILDFMLEKALQPICSATMLLQEWICELLPLITFDSRRKVSIVPAKKLINLGFAAVFAKRKQRFKLIKSMEIERGMIFNIIWKILNMSSDYDRYQIGYCKNKEVVPKSFYGGKLNEIERRFGGDRTHLGPALRCSKWWVEQASDYKSMIMEKYYRLAYQQAIRASHGTSLHISVEDLVKNYILAIDRAINKYSSKRGVLTSYIKYWFKDANINSEHSHQFGTSYSLPNSRRRSLQKRGWLTNKGAIEQNVSAGLEEGVYEKDILQPDHNLNLELLQNRLKKFSKIPEIRMLMLLNGVNYALTEQEIQQQRDSLKAP